MIGDIDNWMGQLETLPPRIREYGKRLAACGQKYDASQREIAEKTMGFVSKYRTLSKEDHIAARQEIDKLYAKAEKLADQKVKLTQKMYQLVDEQIRASISTYESVEKRLEEHYRRAATSIGIQDGNRKRKESLKMTFGMLFLADVDVIENEPTFCLCNEVAKGSMVACDSANCRVEWFHYSCVGLKEGEEPAGQWFCPDCTPAHETKKKIKITIK